jgi:hypothetical protein
LIVDGESRYTNSSQGKQEIKMYYPADMTREDIEAFELDMVAAELIWNELPINWELQELAEGV